MSEEPKYGKLTIIHEIDGERTVQLFPRVKGAAFSYKNEDPYFIRPGSAAQVSFDFDAIADEHGFVCQSIVPVEGERQNLENILSVALQSVTQDALVTNEHARLLVEELSMALVEMGVKLA